MKKLLITGFAPFGGEETNPSWDAVCQLPDEVGGFCLTKLCVPVVFGKAAETVIQKAEEVLPDAIICVGQAGGRSAITPELVGINLRHAAIPDNDGFQPQDMPIDPRGDCAYFSTLPVRKMAAAIASAGIPAQVSYSAGAYVCNDLLYMLLAHFRNTDTKVCFIHVPYATTQGKTPAMAPGDIATALAAAIQSIA